MTNLAFKTHLSLHIEKQTHMSFNSFLLTVDEMSISITSSRGIAFNYVRFFVSHVETKQIMHALLCKSITEIL